MKIYRYPDLPAGFYERSKTDVSATVRRIIKEVRQHGDRAVRYFTRRYDRVVLADIRIDDAGIQRAVRDLEPKLAAVLEAVRRNIRTFAVRQMKAYRAFEFQIRPGVFTGQKVVPVDRVGIYVPAGRYPLVSTLLMCAVPAQVAGVRQIAVCSPPSVQGSVAPAILAAAGLLGLREVYRVGGAQAIAALALGTKTIPAVDKIVGPGNTYVAQAKKALYGGCGIDGIAGPTEVMIIADCQADPSFIAADLLAQAEHDTQASPVLVTDSRLLARRVQRELKVQLRTLATWAVARKALAKNAAIILVRDLAQAIEIANRKAPEHLELQVRRPQQFQRQLRHFGSLFIGRHAAEALGDYSSGLNHTLPTAGSARYTGGLSVRDFLKVQTTLRVTRRGLKAIGPDAETLARAEGLDGHGKSVRRRLLVP